jgi:molecular chaperone Hsp33
MSEVDFCQRFLFEDQDVRGELVKLSSSFQELLAKKNYPPAIENLLGEFLVASVLLCSTIKFDGRLVLQARSEGPISLIMVECDSNQHIRGIVRHNDESMEGNFQTLLTGGTLAITIEPLKGKTYQGIVPLEAGDLSACLQDYFVRSEQLDTCFIFAISNEQCAGMLLQQLPAQLNKSPSSREDQWQTILHLASTVQNKELLSLRTDQVLYRLFNQYPIKMFASKAIQHKCSCSSERTAKALIAIGREEVLAIIEERGNVEISCEFCGLQYQFEPAQLNLLFESEGGDLSR